MRHIISRTFLLTILLSTSTTILHSQDVHEFLTNNDQPGILTDEVSGLGSLLPVQDLLSTEESLSTEIGPAPGDIPVDGGLSLLLAAGAAYGARRLRRSAVEKKRAKGDE